MSMIVDRPVQGLSLLQKVLRLNWALILLVSAVAITGFLMLYSVAGGDLSPWSGRQINRFGAGIVLMLIIALIDIRIWKWFSPFAYIGGVALLVAVEFVGTKGMGAQRWLGIGPLQIQPSELMKIGLILFRVASSIASIGGRLSSRRR